MSEDEVWESDDRVRRTVVLPAPLAERLAARAEQRGLSFSDLVVEYAQDGLDRDGAAFRTELTGGDRPAAADS